MPTARHIGMGLIAFAFIGLTIASTQTDTSRSAADKSYSFAVSGWSRLHLIELGTDWPTKVRAPDDKLMYCSQVLRIADFEIGANCAVKATTIAAAEY